jgi:hypothetical protein
MTNFTSHPNAWRDLGRAPATSARPPVLAKGTASGVVKRICKGLSIANHYEFRVMRYELKIVRLKLIDQDTVWKRDFNPFFIKSNFDPLPQFPSHLPLF